MGRLSTMRICVLNSVMIICLTLSSSSSASTKLSSSCILTTQSIRSTYTDNQTLRVVVPWKVGFQQFVKFSTDSCILDGFSIQVFLQALRHMGRHAPRYEFVLHGNGLEMPSYDELVNLTANGTVDAVVADLTITSDRMERVGFTVPYLASSLVMVTSFRYGSAGTFFDFLTPFTWQLWVTLFSYFVATGIALYLLENKIPNFYTTQPAHDINDEAAHISASNLPNVGHTAMLPATDHEAVTTPSSSVLANNPFSLDPASLQHEGLPIYDEASHQRRIMNAYWYTSLCMIAAQQESVRTNLGRFVALMWLFVMLIFNSSYTASLASLLSAQKTYPIIKSFGALLKDENITVGYQEGSFIRDFLERMKIEPQRLENFTSEEEFVQALRDGKKSKAEGVEVVLDELPYIQILLQSECHFTKVDDDDHLPSFGGFGFAFAKDSPWINEFSKAILAMAEDGTLQVLQNGWQIGGEDNTGRCNEEPSELRLRSLGGLFSILGIVYIISITWRLSPKVVVFVINALRCSQNGSNRETKISRLGFLSRHANRVSDVTLSMSPHSLIMLSQAWWHQIPYIRDCTYSQMCDIEFCS